jgi:hypothetical protein
VVRGTGTADEGLDPAADQATDEHAKNYPLESSASLPFYDPAMKADGVPIEEIARLAERSRIATTELVYPYMSCVPSSHGARRRWTGS